MASLADLNLPSNIVYDERTKRYHDMLQNYRMVSGARVAAMGTPQRADRPDQYVTKQEFLNMRADLFRFVSHTTELTREALQALFEMQRAQLRDTERLRDYELDERENRAEGRESLLRRLLRGSGQLASGAMERVGGIVRARPGLSLATILGASIVGLAAIPNESVERFGNTVDEAVNIISQLTDILGQIAVAGGVLGAAELARRMLQRGQNNRPAPTGQPRPSAPSATTRPPGPAPRSPRIPATSSGGSIPTTPTNRAGSLMRAGMSRLSGPLAAISAATQISEANRELAQGNITREQHRIRTSQILGGAVATGVAGVALGMMGAPLIPAMLGASAIGLAGYEVAGILARRSQPPTTPEQRNQQAAAEEQRLRTQAANTAPGSLERRSLARVEAQNMIRTAQQENRLSQQQAQALSLELGRGGIYQNRNEEVTRVLREGGNLEISPTVARRLNIPVQTIQGGQSRPSITVMQPVTVPSQPQQPAQPTSRQQAQTPVAGLQIRNPEQAMMEALMQHILR
jgi:hypothetical protein